MKTKSEAVAEAAYAEALKLIRRRDRFVGELETKLLESYPPSVVQDVVPRLVKEGWLSDQRTLSAWLNHYAGKNARSHQFIQDKLISLGASAEEVFEALKEIDEVASAVALMQTKAGPVDRTARFLAGRGFSADVIEAALDRLNLS